MLSARRPLCRRGTARSTATSPHSRQSVRSPTSQVSWDNDQMPRSVASSGRRGRAPGERRRDVRSACDSERPTMVTHGQSCSLDGCRHQGAQSAFVLVRARSFVYASDSSKRHRVRPWSYSGRRRLTAGTWNGSWNGRPRNPSAISASGAIRHGICAGHAIDGGKQAPRNAPSAGAD